MFFRKKGAEEMRETEAPRGAESVVTNGPEKPKTEITLKAVPEIPDAEQTDQTTPEVRKVDEEEAGQVLPDAAGEAVNTYIKKAIEMRMEADGFVPPEKP